MLMAKEMTTTPPSNREHPLPTGCRHGWDDDREASDRVSETSAARIRRAVYHHAWTNLEEWALALDELAHLDDSNIEALVAGNRPPQQTISKAA
jgi:hypothetical protein